MPQQQQQQYQPKNETNFNQMTETLQVSETFQNTKAEVIPSPSNWLIRSAVAILG